MGFGQSVVAAISSLGLSHTDPICCIFHKKVHSPTHCVILNLQRNREMAHITWAVGLCAAGGSRGNYVMYSVRLHGDTEVEGQPWVKGQTEQQARYRLARPAVPLRLLVAGPPRPPRHRLHHQELTFDLFLLKDKSTMFPYCTIDSTDQGWTSSITIFFWQS